MTAPIAVIGDVHGEARKLEALLRLVPARHYVFVGDVVNRGPDARTVLETIAQLTKNDNATLVRGNHEATLLSYWSGRTDFVEFALAGGIPTIRSYVPGVTGDVLSAFRIAFPDHHRRVLELALDEFLVRGALVRHWDLHAHNALTTGVDQRSTEQLLIVGHTVVDRAHRIGNIVFLDSGCGTSEGALSAFLLPEQVIVTVS